MLKELFANNPNIVINTDIDGFLSGMFLQKYYGCRIVGFSNSWDYVWLDSEYERQVGENAIYKPIYIDLYVVNPDVVCIEQHIIGYDKKHNALIGSMKTKINPNLMLCDRTFTGDYFHKYPFGTIHFLIAMMEREGVHVQLPDLKSSPTDRMKKYDLRVGEIILRADDALFSSLGKYKPNTDKWWPLLYEKSGSSQSIKKLMDFVSNEDPAQKFKVKDRTGKYFHDEFNCDISQESHGLNYSKVDGAYKNILDESGNLKQEIKNYVNELKQIFGMEMDLPLKYNIHAGTARTMRYAEGGNKLFQENWKNLYSYAFIFGPKSDNKNFSYTVDMK